MTTKLTQQDLKIYASERLHDGDDGGGRMTNQELSGADNELFHPISDVDRVMGAFHCRLLYPAVLRSDKEPLYGSHVVISRPPKLNNVSFLAFAAENYGEEKKDALPRMTAYSVPTIESAMTLLGNPLKGTRMVQAYQAVEEPVPQVGQRFALANATDTDYFRILNLEHAVRTFYDEQGNPFQKRVIKMETTAPLPHDHTGLDYPVKRYARPGSRLLETQVADSMRYYGVRPIIEDIAAQSQTVRLDTVYEQLVPTSTIETAYADQYPIGTNCFIPIGGGQELLLQIKLFNYKNKTIYLPYCVMPGSLVAKNDTVLFQDDGNGNLVGSHSGKIDYATGEIVITGGYSSISADQIYGERAVFVSQADYTAQIPIRDTNQGTEWSPYLLPKPAMGSVAVSFLSGQDWYVIKDRGDGYLFDNAGNGAGRLTRDGSLVVSLPELPDVGSNVVVSWVPDHWYKTFDGQAAGAANVTPKNTALHLALFALPNPNIKPNSVLLTLHTAQGDKTVRDNGSGVVSGSGFTGRVDYAAGQIYLDNAAGVTSVDVALQRYTATPEMKTIALEEDATQIYGVMGEVQAGAVYLACVVKRVDTAGREVNMIPMDMWSVG
ncbi:MAG: hypothetical protein IJV56_08835 [Neisseriaceae bacterium]|nr:hypothetical protein [Neisseriaceae bacterium]MBQ9725423.1 hypothetical protein [Neisseriaceae bacterium]MBR1819781.1 hypothetical protein [Neisseriaceae bacterium]